MYKKINLCLIHFISFFIILLIIPCAYSSPSNKNSYESLQKAVEKELAETQYNYGVGYDTQYSVIKNSAETIEWYKKAAGQGEAKAQYNLGWYYDTGSGIAQDSAKATEWFKKAAEQGSTRAQSALKRLAQ